MGGNSKIEWTEATWNPVTGCTKISPGCSHCYAERMAIRLQSMGQPNYVNGFKLALHEHALDLPLTWKRPRLIFVNSMSDLFHKEVSIDFIKKVFGVMNEAWWHKFQILTKRSARLKEISEELKWTENIWMGVSVESEDYLHRIEDLRQISTFLRFISLEPLLGPISHLNLKGINWVIVGGESGPGARPIQESWVINIRNLCMTNGVPFFFKQWGGSNKKISGRRLEGRTWNQMPSSISA